MFLPALAADAAWYGPATATFLVQFAGDPYDPKRNDVRVRFLGDRSQREERPAYFDPAVGGWRATLFAAEEGRYRAILVRNGKDVECEPQEGILDLAPALALGYLPAKTPGAGRPTLDTGAPWIAFGANLGDDPTPARVDALADAGANWVRVASPADPLAYDALIRFGAAMDEVERRGLAYTLALPASSTAAWRRYALARFGGSPRLVGWEGAVEDPRLRATAPTAEPWPALFENRPGPFLVREDDAPRLKALRTVVELSGLPGWANPRPWKGPSAKGVADGDRMILVAEPGAKLVGLPLADGAYDLATFDPATGAAVTGQARVERAALALPVPAERFFVLRRRL